VKDRVKNKTNATHFYVFILKFIEKIIIFYAMCELIKKKISMTLFLSLLIRIEYLKKKKHFFFNEREK
jgi:hypothetical protein